MYFVYFASPFFLLPLLTSLSPLIIIHPRLPPQPSPFIPGTCDPASQLGADEIVRVYVCMRDSWCLLQNKEGEHESESKLLWQLSRRKLLKGLSDGRGRRGKGEVEEVERGE